MTSPWTSDETWLRCTCMGTTRSDDELAPRHLARQYRRASYDVLAAGRKAWANPLLI